MHHDETPSAEALIEAILRKLKANHEVLTKSLTSGTLEWDLTNKGKFNVKLRPRI